MKTCVKCNEVKPLTEFHKRKGSKDGHQGRCKKCSYKAAHESYKKRVPAIKKRFVDYLGGCCQLCGYDKYQGALEFHHKDPTQKDFHLSDNYSKPWEVVVKELDKCALLCSNCHKEVHGGIVHLT